MIDELQWSRSSVFCEAECFPWTKSIDPVTRHSCWCNMLCLGPSSALVWDSEMITSPSRCTRSCSIAIFSCLYERAVSNLNCCSYCECRKPIMSAAVMTPRDPPEVLLTQSMLLRYYPQRHGNDAANRTFYCVVCTLWPEMPWKTASWNACITTLL